MSTCAYVSAAKPQLRCIKTALYFPSGDTTVSFKASEQSGCRPPNPTSWPTPNPRGSLQKRPMGDGSKPANGCSRDLVLLAQFLFLRQARFCAPTPRTAFQDVTVV
jgi:hypothetical protein